MGKIKSVQEDTPEIQVYRYYTEKTRYSLPISCLSQMVERKKDIIRKISFIGRARKTE